MNKSGPIALTSNFAYGQRRSSLAAEGSAASGKALGEVARLSSDEALQRLSSSKNGLTPRRLVVGSILFGVGWGLVGLCPGPALVNLAGLMPSVMVFVVAMGAGMILKDLWDRRVLSGTPVRDDTLSPSTDS